VEACPGTTARAQSLRASRRRCAGKRDPDQCALLDSGDEKGALRKKKSTEDRPDAEQLPEYYGFAGSRARGTRRSERTGADGTKGERAPKENKVSEVLT